MNPDPLRLPSPPARRFERWLIGAALAVVVGFYFWTVSAAGGFDPANDSDYYNLLVRGYRQGHLYLDYAPAPEMLTLADPYDPAQNGPYRLPDATYYHGHYYLYFGAVPAVLLLWPYAAITGRALPLGAAVWVFGVIGFLAASGLWLTWRRRYFPASSALTGVGGVLTLGFATHVLALARRPTIYELPIAAGYAFLMLALVAVDRAVDGRRPVRALGAAGLLIGLAAASRPPCVFGALMLLPVLWWAGRNRAAWWWRGGLAAAAGLGLCGAAMLAHNYARFGNALEFGQNYQLTAARELNNRHFGFDYMLHNFRVYYFCPVRWTWEFPFVAAQTPVSTIRDHAGSEEMAGLLVTLPILWLAIAAPLAWRGREERESRSIRAVLGSVAGLYVGVGGFLLAFFSTTERYVAEFAPALGLLAVCGWLAIERWARAARVGLFVRPVMFAGAIASFVLGVLVSFDYHGRMLSRGNPELWSRLERAGHATLAGVGLWLGEFTGPRVLKVRFQPRPAGTIETFWRAGDARADERIMVEHLGGRELRFGYARGDAPVRWGRRLTWELGHTHTVEVQLPSLYGPPRRTMRGLRSAEEFRERSCAVVWFSGGRALAEIVLPHALDLAPGGAVGMDFSGELRSAGVRLFREDEFAARPGVTDPRGGTLRLRLVLPAALAPEGEPLFAAGALYGSDMVFVRGAAGGATEFRFEHFGAPHVVSASVPLAPLAEHTIEITLPSFALGENFSRAGTGDVSVRVNGTEALRGRSDCYGFAAGEEAVGRNPFGTTCAREFRGWLLEARWMGAAP